MARRMPPRILQRGRIEPLLLFLARVTSKGRFKELQKRETRPKGAQPACNTPIGLGLQLLSPNLLP